MYVPVLSIIFMSTSAVISIGAPVCLFLFFRRKFNSRALPMVLGIAGFVIFAMLLEGTIHRVVLGKFPLKQEAPVVYIIYGIFMAGIFEETARFVAFKILKRKYAGIGTALSYGIGHGGIESALLAGVSMLIAIVASIIINTGNAEIITGRFRGEALAAINTQMEALLTTAPYMFFISGIERMMAIAIQLSLTVVVFYSVYGNNKLWLFPLAVLLHAIIDIPAAAAQTGLLKNILLVEGIVCLCAVSVFVFTKYLHEKLKPITPIPDPSP
jgi:uncharacterized membrane protein YhfC